jgi:hypothetical protein
MRTLDLNVLRTHGVSVQDWAMEKRSADLAIAAMRQLHEVNQCNPQTIFNG